MEALIQEISRKLYHLPKVKIFEVLDFVEFLGWNKDRSTSLHFDRGNDFQGDAEFEAIADCLADEFARYAAPNTPVLSDYALSRAGIYEEHPSLQELTFY